MVYQNPIIRGYYPDPSVCRVNGKYYLVASSFHYFPGVPLFESDDLVNWQPIGFCLTRESQLPLKNVRSSGGIYAPTIRHNEGRFYMATTNVGHERGGNFYVWTDDIYGEWSEPIKVDQGGIDPSLYFEGGKAFFTSNGEDEHGKNAIFQCEIDISTGKKLTESKAIWYGCGGRYLEAPHLYKIKGRYYLIAAEGGTEYGHMIVYARSDNLWGPFTPYAHNPVLTNRNLGGYELQGIGHGDLLEDADADANANWWIFALGFRQIDKWQLHHHLGRETCLFPVTFDGDGWFTIGNGTAAINVDTDRIPSRVSQRLHNDAAFGNTRWDRDWQFLRSFTRENYIFGADSIKIKSSADTLDTPAGNPAFICTHQKEFNMKLSVQVKTLDGEAGISVYMDENHHYDLALRKTGNEYTVILKLNIGGIRHEKALVSIAHNEARFLIRSCAYEYSFYLREAAGEKNLGTAQTKYLSSEVAGGFTGVVLGLYSQGCTSGLFNEFRDFKCGY